MENGSQANRTTEMGAQYSLARILGIWALATIPMGVLSWIVFPALVPDSGSDPLAAGVRRIALLTCGLIWLFVLSMIIVRQEEGDLRWATVKRRLQLNVPRDPDTGETRRSLWLWVVPFLIASVVWVVSSFSPTRAGACAARGWASSSTPPKAYSLRFWFLVSYWVSHRRETQSAVVT